MIEEHEHCGTPDCCGQCSTATEMKVIENNDGTKTIIFIPIVENLPES